MRGQQRPFWCMAGRVLTPMMATFLIVVLAAIIVETSNDYM